MQELRRLIYSVSMYFSETSGLFHQADANVEKQGHHPEKATDRLTKITKGFEKNTCACRLQSLNLITPLL